MSVHRMVSRVVREHSEWYGIFTVLLINTNYYYYNYKIFLQKKIIDRYKL